MSHIRTSHVSHMNESCHTYEFAVSHVWRDSCQVVSGTVSSDEFATRSSVGKYYYPSLGQNEKYIKAAVCMCACSVLQCVAVCCSVLQFVTVLRSASRLQYVCVLQQCVVVCCIVLQCVAVCCSVLQCVAVCCSSVL